MKEKKNKKTNQKTTTKKTNTNKKVAASKKTNTKKVVTSKAKQTNKKLENKKPVAKAASRQTPKKVQKTSPKKVETKKAQNPIVKAKEAVKASAPEIKKVSAKSEQLKAPEIEVVKSNYNELEKTMVFDGTQRKNLEEVVNKLGEDKVVLKDKVVKRRPINKYIIYVLSALIFITILGTFIFVRHETKKGKNEPEISYERLNPEDYRQSSASDIESSSTIKDQQVEIKYSNIKTITIDEFEAKYAEGENMLVLISSETCSFSITAEPVYNKVLSEEKKNMYRLDITLMDNDENTRLRNIYPYTATPTTIAIKNGEVVSEVEGKQSDSEFRNWVKTNS